MKRKIGSFLLATVLLIATAIPALAATNPFSDAQKGWYVEAVDYAHSNNIFSGTSNTKFSPEVSMTRGMFVTVLGRKVGINKDDPAYAGRSFGDVKESMYYAPYIKWASSNGIVNGTGTNKFSPESKITREAMVTMLYRYMEKAGGSITFSPNDIMNYIDRNKISGWAETSMQWATSRAVIKGKGNGILAPKANMSRAECAQIFFNLKSWDFPGILPTPNPTPTPTPNTKPTTSQKNALAKAKEYLDFIGFSRDGLIGQLEYEKFSHADAVYAVENCGANWRDQAVRKAKEYLNNIAFSYSGLVDQLVFEKFSNADAVYAVDKCGANWNEQAAKKAKDYLKITSFSRAGLIDQLEFDGFTNAQAVYGVNAAGL